MQRRQKWRLCGKAWYVLWDQMRPYELENVMSIKTFTTNDIRYTRGIDYRVWVDARSLQDMEIKLRDQFAMSALQHIMSHDRQSTTQSEKAKLAYEMADEMIKARREPDVHSKDEKIEYDRMIAGAWKNSLLKS